MATRIRVVDLGDSWEVRFNGLPHGQYRLKADAVANGRKLARAHQPDARLDVQNRFTGTWKTLVTW